MRVVLLGCVDAPEFAEVLFEVTQGSDTSFVSRADCGELTDADYDSDLLVVLQRFPEEYSRQQALNLLNRFASSRLVVCCGPWCDSDGRTRSLWPPACRARLESAAVRLRHELSVVRNRAKPLPLTANRDETFLLDYGNPGPDDVLVEEGTLRIAVDAVDPAFVAWLQATLKQAGHEVVSRSDTCIDIRLCDVDPWTPAMAASVAEMRRTQPQVLLIALTGYLRFHETDDIRQAGANAVVGKLAPLSEILRAINHVVAKQGIVGNARRSAGEASDRGLRIVSDDS